MDGVVVSDVSKKKKTNSVLLQISNVKANDSWFPTSGNVLLYIDKDAICPNYGDKVIVKASPNIVSRPSNPDEFDYKRYLAFKGIYHQCYVKNNHLRILSHNEANSIISTAISLRKEAEKYIDMKFSNKREASIAKAMILGSRNNLDGETIKAYSSTGAMHVLAVSGLHVGIVYLLLKFLFQLFPNTKRLKLFNMLVSIICIWMFAILTGLSASVTRAAIMFTVMAIGRGFQKQSNIINTMSFCAFCMLLIAPYSIMEVGFQLSYCAVIGIVYLQPKFEQLLQPKYWITKKIWLITTVSIAAQLATFPISLLYFHQFPLLFILSNLVVIPCAFLILLLGLVMFFTVFIPAISNVLAWIVEFTIGLVNKIIFAIDQTSYTLLTGIDISVLETWLIYVLIAATSYFIWGKSKSGLKVGFGCLVILFTINISETVTEYQQQSLVVYKTNQHTSIDLISGTNHIFESDSSLIKDESSLLFHIKHHWWHLNLDESLHATPEKPIHGYEWNHHQVYIVTSNSALAALHKLNFHAPILVIGNNAIKNLNELSFLNQETQIVFDASNSYKNSYFLRKQNESIGMNCHFVNLDNAFVINK